MGFVIVKEARHFGDMYFDMRCGKRQFYVKNFEPLLALLKQDSDTLATLCADICGLQLGEICISFFYTPKGYAWFYITENVNNLSSELCEAFRIVISPNMSLTIRDNLFDLSNNLMLFKELHSVSNLIINDVIGEVILKTQNNCPGCSTMLSNLYKCSNLDSRTLSRRLCFALEPESKWPYTNAHRVIYEKLSQIINVLIMMVREKLRAEESVVIMFKHSQLPANIMGAEYDVIYKVYQ
jgi:hypothetical protein